MKKLISILYLTLVFNVLGSSFTSTQSGLFSAPSTWVGGVQPHSDGDTWTISNGHTVWYDTNNLTMLNGWGGATITGTLAITNITSPPKQIGLLMNGFVSGNGTWTVGSTNTPISYMPDYQSGVVLQFKGGNNCAMINASQLNFQGDSRRYLGFLSNSVSSGTVLFLSNSPPVFSNDVICLGSGMWTTNIVPYLFVVSNVVGTEIFLQLPASPITNTWPNCIFAGSIVTNTPVGTPVMLLSHSIAIINDETSGNYFNQVEFSDMSGMRLEGWARALPAYHSNFRNCSVAGGNFGSLLIGATYCHAVGCDTFNTYEGGIVESCVNSTVIGCNSISTQLGGISESGYGAYIVGCNAFNVDNGGIVNNGFQQHIEFCYGQNVRQGGIISGTLGDTVQNCSAQNIDHGGIIDGATTSFVAACSTANVFRGEIGHNNFRMCAQDCVGQGATNDVAWDFNIQREPFDVTQCNYNFYSQGGITKLTNDAAPFGTAYMVHFATNLCQINLTPADFPLPVSWFSRVYSGALSTNIASVWLWLTNGVSYQVQAVPDGCEPNTNAAVYSSMGGWTNFTYSVGNTNSFGRAYWLWVTANCSNNAVMGRSWVSQGTTNTFPVTTNINNGSVIILGGFR